MGVGGCAGCGVGGALPLPLDMAGAVNVAAATAAVDVMHVVGDDVGAVLVVDVGDTCSRINFYSFYSRDIFIG